MDARKWLGPVPIDFVSPEELVTAGLAEDKERAWAICKTWEWLYSAGVGCSLSSFALLCVQLQLEEPSYPEFRDDR